MCVREVGSDLVFFSIALTACSYLSTTLPYSCSFMYTGCQCLIIWVLHTAVLPLLVLTILGPLQFHIILESAWQFLPTTPKSTLFFFLCLSYMNQFQGNWYLYIIGFYHSLLIWIGMSLHLFRLTFLSILLCGFLLRSFCLHYSVHDTPFPILLL